MPRVDLTLGTRVDLAGINQLKKELAKVRELAGDYDIVGGESIENIQKTINATRTLETALNKAYDVKLNTVNIEKFNKYLKTSGVNLSSLYKDLSRIGIEGQQAFLTATNGLLTMNKTVKQSNALIDKMALTFKNTVMWGLSSGLWNTMLTSVSKASGYIKGIDKDLNDIRIVTGKSADQMERFVKSANKAAKDLAVSTRDYTQGALIYYQQGDTDEEAAAKAGITAKAANVTGQDMSTVSEQLTAVWNGYQVANQAASEGMQVYEEYVDKMAAVGAETASDLEELATAMSKVASAASSMGVDFDQLNAQIATIVSVTRQAPESVGTALKTIYARLGDLQVDGVDEFGTSLGQVSSQLQTMGIEVVDSNGQMREMGTVMTEVAEKWDTWTSSQKQAAAVAMAGKRQYNNLISLFDNWDMYEKSLGTSMNAAGTLTEQQGIAVESLDKKMQRLSTTSERLYNSLVDVDSVGGIIDGLTSMVETIGDLSIGLGGLQTILPIVGGLLLKTFSGHIGKGLATTVENIKKSLSEDTDELLRNQAAKNITGTDFAKEAPHSLTEEEKASGKTLTDEQEKENEQFEWGKKEIQYQAENYKNLVKYKELMTEEERDYINQLNESSVKIAKDSLTYREHIQFLEDKEKALEENKSIQEELNILSQEELETLKLLADTQEMIRKDDEGEYAADSKLKDIGANIQQSRFIGDKIIEQQMFSNSDITGIEEEQDKTIKQLTDTMGGQLTLEETTALAEEITQLSNKYRELEGSAGDYEFALQQLVKETLDTNELTQEQGQLIEELGKQYEKENEIIKNFNENAAKWFKEQVEGIEELASAFEGSEDLLEKASLRFQGLIENGEDVAGAMRQVGEEFKLSADQAQQMTEQYNQMADERRRIEDSTSDFSDSKELESNMESLAEATGSFIQVGGGLAGIVNSFNAAMDPSVDSSERWKNAMMGLVVAIPMAVTGFMQFTTSVKALTGAETFLLGVKNLLNGTTIKEIMIKKLDTIITAENTNAHLANAAAKLKSSLQSKNLLLALGPYLLILAAVAAAIALVVHALNEHQKAYEDNAKQAQEQLDAQKKVTEETRKQKDAIDSLVSSYKDLKSQYDDGEISLEQLRSKTYDLCLQYEQQDLALQALIADQESLNNLMMQAQSSANIKAAEEIGKEANLTKNVIKSQATRDTKEWMRDNGGETIDVVDTWSVVGNTLASMGTFGIVDLFGGGASKAIKDNEELNEVLQKYGIEGALEGQISSEDFYNAMIDNYDALYEDLSKVDDGDALIEMMENQKENIDSYQALREEQNAIYKDEIINSNSQDIKDFYDYQKALASTISQGREKDLFDSEEELQKWAESNLMGALDDKTIAIDSKVAERLAQEKGYDYKNLTSKQLSEIETEIENFSDAEKNFLYMRVNTLDAEESVEEFLSKYEKQIEAENKKDIGVTIKTIVEADAEQLSELDLDNLYQGGDFEKFVGLSKEQFSTLDYDEQRIKMIQYYADSQRYLAENKDAILEESQAKLEAFQAEEKYQGYRVDWIQRIGSDYWVSSYSKEIAELEKIGYSQADLLQAMQSYAAGDELVGNQSVILENFEEIYRTINNPSANWDIYEHLYKNIGLARNLFQEYNEELNALTDDVNKAANTEADYSGVMKQSRNAMQASVDSISNLANEYETLTEIVDSYNEGNGLSIDNVSALLSMSSDMLTALEFENGQMHINKDSLMQVVQGRILDAKAMLYEEIQAYALQYRQKQVAEATQDAGEKTIITAKQVAAASGVAEESSLAWLDYWDAVAGPNSTSYQDEEYLNTMENYRKQLLSLDELSANMSLDSLFGMDKEGADIDDIVDRYWDLNKAIDEVGNSLERLDKIQDKLQGKGLADSLERENQLLEKQVANYQALADEQAREAAELRNNLASANMSFDQYGYITNYAEVTQSMLDKAKSGAIDEDSYDKFKEDLERYDELFYSEMVETANEISEITSAILENNLEGWKAKIDVELELQEAERDWNEFLHNINTDFKSQYEDLDNSFELISKKANSYLGDNKTLDIALDKVRTIQNEITKLKSGQGSTMFETVGQAQEELKTATEDLVASAEEMFGLYEESWDTYLEGIDQASEKFSELMDKYEDMNNELEYQSQLINLLYGEKAYNMFDTLYKAQETVGLSQVKSIKTQMDLYEQQMKEEAVGSEARAKFYEQWQEQQDALNSKVTEYIQLLQTDLANSIKAVVAQLQKDVAGMSADDLASEWERAQEISSRTLDNVESIYGIQSLANKIKDSINDTSDVKVQKQLQDLYDKEIDYLREKEELTQFDLDAAEARYEIALKEIALQEAQNNKSTMRLARDSQGNYSYQYVADEDNILDKQQELADAYAKLYDLSKTAYEENLAMLTEMQAEYYNDLEEIYARTDLSNAEREELARQRTTQYYEDMEFYARRNEEIKITLTNATIGALGNAYRQDAENFNMMTQQEQDAVTALAEHGISRFIDVESSVVNNLDNIGTKANEITEQNLLYMIGASQTLADTWNSDDGSSVKSMTNAALDSISERTNDYQNQLSELESAAGQNFNNITGSIRNTESGVRAVEQAVYDLADETSTSLENHRNRIVDIANAWGSVAGQLQTAITRTSELLREEENLLNVELQRANVGGATGNGSYGGGNGSGGEGPNLSQFVSDRWIDGFKYDIENFVAMNGATLSTEVMSRVHSKAVDGKILGSELNAIMTRAVREGLLDYNDFGTLKTPGFKASTINLASATNPVYAYAFEEVPYTNSVTLNKGYGKFFKDIGEANAFSKQIYGSAKFDTGGYTGTWSGNDGKFAILHEKELVLNADDTKNILETVQATRGLGETLSLVNHTVMNRILSMVDGLKGLAEFNSSQLATAGGGSALQQSVHISATFEGATDRKEIEAAFDSLINKASQRAFNTIR